MQNLHPSNIKVIFQRQSGHLAMNPVVVALGFIAGSTGHNEVMNSIMGNIVVLNICKLDTY